MKLEIYQLKDDIDPRMEIHLQSYDNLMKMRGIRNNLKVYYKMVYQGDYDNVEGYEDTFMILDKLYADINMNRFKNKDTFNGIGIKTSTIVGLDDTLYFCDEYGWEEIV